MRKWLIRIFVVLIVLGVLGWLMRAQIFQVLLAAKLKPDGSFASETMPLAPNYNLDTSWAALPERQDFADHVPDSRDFDNQGEAAVAVFYVHPTTHIRNTSWVAAIDDDQAREVTDRFVMKSQASAFNGCCAIYAPLYRQATLYSFWDETGQGRAARDFAYGDVERAFEHFLMRIQGQPFILAGHSQGAEHLLTLMEKRISGTPLMQRFVAAYPVGKGFDGVRFAKAAPDIPLCERAEQTGCYVTWNALGPKAKLWPDMKDTPCVNPLSWKADGAAIPAAANLGAFGLKDLGADKDQITPEFAAAQCRDNYLLVTNFRNDMFDNLPFNMGRDNYHILDYALFYQNIRANAVTRSNAWLATKRE